MSQYEGSNNNPKSTERSERKVAKTLHGAKTFLDSISL